MSRIVLGWDDIINSQQYFNCRKIVFTIQSIVSSRNEAPILIIFPDCSQSQYSAGSEAE